MKPIVKTYWRESPSTYTLYEIQIVEDKLTLKEWWDPGHDPNMEQVALSDFEKSRTAENIQFHLGEKIHLEVLDSVKTILHDLNK